MWTSYEEARTADGVLLRLTIERENCEFSETEKAQLSLLKNVLGQIKSVEVPVDHKVNVSHGGYGMYSRYEIFQHKYAGGHGGYIEVLEIKNPPSGRHGIVIHEYICTHGFIFTEFKNLESACAAYEKYWQLDCNSSAFKKCDGFFRRVYCGPLNPWFYAIGNEELVGDFTFPHHIQEDSVFRFGRQFIVMDNDFPVIKSCMGCRFVHRERQNNRSMYSDRQEPEKFFRIAYFDDGSSWEEGSGKTMPIPMEEGSLFITEALQEFKKFISGQSQFFTIDLTDGYKFIGKLVKSKETYPTAEGSYFVRAQVKGEKKVREGRVDFKPDEESPNIFTKVVNEFAKINKEVESFEIVEVKNSSGGKKWKGLFISL